MTDSQLARTRCLSMLVALFLTACGSGKQTSSGTETADAPVVPPGTAVKRLQIAGEPPSLLSAEFIDDEIAISWESLLPGDYNLDQVVDGRDVFPIAVHFQQKSSFGGEEPDDPGNDCIDGTRDGVIDGRDLFTVAVNFLNRANGYVVLRDSAEDGEFTDRIQGLLLNNAGCGAEESTEFARDVPLPFWLALAAWDSTTEEWGDIGNALEVNAPPPPVPENLTATPATVSPIKVNVDWDPVETEDPALTYRLLGRLDAAGPPWGEPLVQRLEQPGFVHLDVQNDQTWFYAVQTVHSYGPASDLSAPAEAFTGDPIPPSPEDFSITAFPGKLELNWTPVPLFEDFARYELFFKPSDDPNPFQLLQTFSDRTASTFMHEGLENERAYLYRLHCVDLSEQSSGWTEGSGMPSAAPDAPTGLECSPLSTKEIALSWIPPPDEDIASYRVFRSPDLPGPPWERLAPMRVIDQPSFTDWRCRPSETWYYVVTAVDQSGIESSYSEPAGATTLEPSAATEHNVEVLSDIFKQWRPYLILDGEGVPWISCADTYGVSVVTWEGGDEWRLEEIDSEVQNMPWIGPSMAINPLNGRPAMSYADSDGTAYAEWTGTGWDIETFLPGENFESSLCITGDGVPLIAISQMSDTGFIPTLFFGERTGGDWSFTPVYVGSIFTLYDPWMILDPEGMPLISFGTMELKVARHDGFDWGVVTVPQTEMMGFESQPVFDSSGNLWVAHTVLQSSLHYSRLVHTQWETTDISKDWTAVYTPRIAFDALDRPILVFRASTEEVSSNLLMMTYDGWEWAEELLVDGNEGSLYYMQCMQFDDHGNMALCYYDLENGRLRLSWYY